MNQAATVTPINRQKSPETDQNSQPGDQASNAQSQKEMFAASLLAFEAEVRVIGNEKELLNHLCNTSRRFLPFRQSFYIQTRSNAKHFTVAVASGIAVVDRNAPFIRWLEKVASRASGKLDFSEQQTFSLMEYSDEQDEEIESYPFPDALWTPAIDGDNYVGGFISVREYPWIENEQSLATRLVGLYVHALRAIKGQNRLSRKKLITPLRAALVCAAIALVGIIPMPITALAPVEVVPEEPFIVAAPFDGVVEEILVEQGQLINEGDAVVAFDDVRLSNERKIVGQRERVAQVRFEKSSQSAIADHTAKQELAVAKSEFELAQAESLYAQEMLDKTKLKAEKSGIAIYSDKRDWTGKPVSAGEAVLQIADPDNIRFSIDLPVKDSLVLEKGARVKVFLDSDPLKPLEATLTEASYQARSDKRDILAYTISAKLDATDEPNPRIGVQGTAQVFGEKAPLAYVLFRRPLAAFRQFTGW